MRSYCYHSKCFVQRGGAQNSSEKERYFVAKNAADNFVIEYFTKKGGAKKGMFGELAFVNIFLF